MRLEEFLSSVCTDCQVDLHQVEVSEGTVRFRIIDSDCEFAFEVYDIEQTADGFNVIQIPAEVE